MYLQTLQACQDMPMWWENLLTNTDWLQDLAEKYLQQYPDNGFLTVSTIELWYNSFYYEYKRKTLKEYIEKAYALILRLLKDRMVLDEFFSF